MWTNHGLKIMNLNVNLPMFLSAGTDDGHLTERVKLLSVGSLKMMVLSPMRSKVVP